MTRRVVHLSRIIRRPAHTVTSTACNRHRTTSDGMNIAEKDADVTCKFCLAILQRRAMIARGEKGVQGG